MKLSSSLLMGGLVFVGLLGLVGHSQIYSHPISPQVFSSHSHQNAFIRSQFPAAVAARAFSNRQILQLDAQIQSVSTQTQTQNQQGTESVVALITDEIVARNQPAATETDENEADTNQTYNTPTSSEPTSNLPSSPDTPAPVPCTTSSSDSSSPSDSSSSASSALVLPSSSRFLSVSSHPELSSSSWVRTYSFPKGHPTIYVTSSPDHGAGVGHQVGEWIHGVYLAATLNLTYIFSPFEFRSVRWNSFMGLGEGEETEDMLRVRFPNLKYVERKERPDHPDLEIERWLREDIKTYQESGQPILYHFAAVHIPRPSMFCLPAITLTMRKKYCSARVRAPLLVNLFDTSYYDGEAGRKALRMDGYKKAELMESGGSGGGIQDLFGEDVINVGMHIRCGDVCYDREAPFPVVIQVITNVANALQSSFNLRANFHLFSQAPPNDTSTNHFAPLLAAPELSNLSIIPHWSASSAMVFDHLVRADLMIGSYSGFSRYASVLRGGVSLDVIEGCKYSLPYDYKGNFDVEKFADLFKKTRHLVPKFQNYEECDALEAE